MRIPALAYHQSFNAMDPLYSGPVVATLTIISSYSLKSLAGSPSPFSLFLPLGGGSSIVLARGSRIACGCEYCLPVAATDPLQTKLWVESPGSIASILISSVPSAASLGVVLWVEFSR